MIDLATEKLVLVEKCGHLFPEPEPTQATLFRWADPARGCAGCVLESLKIGRRRYTTENAIHRFIFALNASSSEETPGVTPGQRARQAETADKVLQDAGL